MKNAVQRGLDLPSAAILLTALFISAARLTSTGWSPGLGIASGFAVMGVVLGLLLGRSRFRRTGLYLLTFGYSLIVIPWLLGNTQYPDLAWQERFISLGGRLVRSFSQFFYQKPVEDPILFIAFAAVVYWSLGVHAGYALVRRGSFLPVVLPAGILLFIVQLYDAGTVSRSSLLAFYLFLCLLLLGRLIFLRKRLSWSEERVWLSSESVTDLNITIFVTALVVVSLAWVAPTSVRQISAAKNLWDEAAQPWQAAREKLNNVVASLKANNNANPVDFYAETLDLGQEGASGDMVLFTVRAPVTDEVGRYYWRVRTYDQYLMGEWHASAASERSFSPNEKSINTIDTRRKPIAEFGFTISNRRISTLITPLHPIWFSRPGTFTFTALSRGEEDSLLLNVKFPIQPGETYKVRASLFNPSIKQLREAGTDYPSWVTDRYLQLPDNLAQSIADLARKITTTATNPYDKADIITNYLRNEIRYSKTIPPTPAGLEPLSWFLFDVKEGFCNYYATADVILLRTLGVPARLAVGFAEGEYSDPDRFTVRLRNSHSWPEVYFPGIGWVEFEPTTSQLPLQRPSGVTAFDSGSPAHTPQGEGNQEEKFLGTIPLPGGNAGSQSRTPLNSLLIVLLIFGVLNVIIVGVREPSMFGNGTWISLHTGRNSQEPFPVLVMRAMEKAGLPSPRWLGHWAFLATLTPIERAFRAIYQSLHWLGGKTSPTQTPAEAATALKECMPDGVWEIQTLLEQYQRSLFSLRSSNLPIARLAAESIRRKSIQAAMRVRLNVLLNLPSRLFYRK